MTTRMAAQRILTCLAVMVGQMVAEETTRGNPTGNNGESKNLLKRLGRFLEQAEKSLATAPPSRAPYATSRPGTAS